MLRTIGESDSKHAQIIKKSIESGEMVSDNVISAMLKSALNSKKCKNGFILDGYPRTLEQANNLSEILSSTGIELDGVAELRVPTEELLKRAAKRQICPNCGSSFHAAYNPPVIMGICDDCQTQLSQRKDDASSTVKKRLKLYENTYQKIINFYSKQGMAFHVTATPEGKYMEKIDEWLAKKQTPLSDPLKKQKIALKRTNAVSPRK